MVVHAQGQDENRYNLTLDEALDLARARAPTVLAARARIDVARGRLTGASVWQPFNPQVQAGAGPRWSDSGEAIDVDVGLSQRFELGGRRAARIAGAEAGVDEASARAEAATRRLLRDVAASYLRAAYAEERLGIARDNEALTADLLRAARRRYEAGGVGILDVNVATVAHARAQASIRRWQAARVSVLGELRVLLGLPAGTVLAIQGDLRDRQRYSLDALLARAPERADLRALVAEVRQADAELDLGRGFAWPNVGVFVRYGREEGADIVLGGLSLSIPLFDRGQGLRATGAARGRVLRLSLDAARRAVSVQVRSAWDAYRLLVQAAEEFEEQALPSLEENLNLARRSYEAGNIAIGELLVFRREVVDARESYAELLLDASLAGVELEARAGALR